MLHSQILAQLNLPISTMSLVEEDGDLERASKPWNLVQSGHTIGNPEPIFAEMVLVTLPPYLRWFLTNFDNCEDRVLHISLRSWKSLSEVLLS